MKQLSRSLLRDSSSSSTSMGFHERNYHSPSSICPIPSFKWRLSRRRKKKRSRQKNEQIFQSKKKKRPPFPADGQSQRSVPPTWWVGPRGHAPREGSHPSCVQLISLELVSLSTGTVASLEHLVRSSVFGTFQLCSVFQSDADPLLVPVCSSTCFLDKSFGQLFQ